MTYPCPCCGSQMEEPPDVRFLARDAGLSVYEHAIVRELAAAKQPLTLERMIPRIYTHSDGPPENVTVSLMVMFGRVRKKLAPYGWTISNLHPTGRGMVGRYCLQRI